MGRGGFGVFDVEIYVNEIRVTWDGSVDPMCLGFEEGNERGRGGLQISGWGLARVYARARLRECHGVVSTMEIFGRGLSVQDEGQAVCRGSSALGGERGGRCMWGVVSTGRRGRTVRGSQARARRARKEPARRARGERARRARRRRTKPARGTAFAGAASRSEMWSSIHVSKSRPSFGRHARSGTRDVISELASPA